MGQLKGYLTTIGYINDKNVTTVRLGYVMDSADPTYEQRLKASEDVPVVASQYAADGALIMDYRVPINHVHADPAQQALLFAGKVPLDVSTQKIVLRQKGAVLATLAIPPSSPKLGLTWKPAVPVAGVQRITWQATHGDGAPMEFMVLYSSDGGQTFRQLSQSLTDMAFAFDFDRLPGGKGVIKVLATDGGNTVSAMSESFAVPTRPVLAMILSPADKAAVDGRWVTLQGQGYLLEEDRPELQALRWTSSIDGMLGTGRIVQSRLSPGTHTITLAAGQDNRQGRAAITLNVR